MSTYYQVIDGHRYNASLLRHALLRVKGPGDGRISHQDAMDLWQLAQDGGRITETEEDTLVYLLQTLKWTPSARAWINGELARETEAIGSYYKVIDKQRYDRKIIEEAERLTAGRGDGRISKTDAGVLLPLFGDMGDVTVVEERTLQYLLEHFKWTKWAKKWFQAHFEQISKQSDVEAALRDIIRDEFGLEGLQFAYYRSEVLQQMLDFENEVDLPEALRQALRNLLDSTADRSFGALLSGYTSDTAAEFLAGGRLVLLPGDMASEPSLASFPAPSKGEGFGDYWIFGLELFDLTDDIYWLIVARDGTEPAYNYIGGPNVEDEWPRGGSASYFTVRVEAFGQPYPNLTVDVQYPDGRYMVTKSNAQGEVRVTGPAGKYGLFASDGDLFHTTIYQWDGEGADTVKTMVLDR